MKQIIFQFLLFLLCVSSIWEMSAQQTLLSVPQINFQRCLGGSGQDSSIFATVTSTGDYLFIGNTTSTNGDVVGNHGGKDIWMVKANASGTILTQACYGGANNDYVTTVKDLGNDEYLLSGVAQSGNGNVVGYSGSGQDNWTLRINASGTILWQQCIAGTLIQSFTLSNGNLLKVSWVSSASSANNYHGGIDSWVSITDPSTGNMLLNKCYGGTGDDKIKKVWEESGAIVLAGATNSTNGDITGQHGGYDVWILKIDAAGNILNQNVLGGSDEEYFKNAYKNSFGNYIIDAYSASQDGNIGNYQILPTNINYYYADSVSQFWSIMLDNSLTLQWEKTINTLSITMFGFFGIFPTSLMISGPNSGAGVLIDVQSIPTYDGGVWLFGNTYDQGSYMYYYAVKISQSGIIQSNTIIETLGDLTDISYSYYLTSNATLYIHMHILDVCPTCGFNDYYNHREISMAGQLLSRCDTNIYTVGGAPIL